VINLLQFVVMQVKLVCLNEKNKQLQTMFAQVTFKYQNLHLYLLVSMHKQHQCIRLALIDVQSNHLVAISTLCFMNYNWVC
jgi:hypothetical protein